MVATNAPQPDDHPTIGRGVCARARVVDAVPALALTFDDGPDRAWTPRLLELLRALGARATFFPIAARAAAHRSYRADAGGGAHGRPALR